MKKFMTKAFVISIVAIAATGFASFAHAEEDDGTPYKHIAKKVGPPSKGNVADVMNYGYWAGKQIEEQFKAVDENSAVTGNRGRQSAQCSAFNESIAGDRVIDIRYALGYFDNSDGHSMIYENLDWGRSVSADEGASIAIRQALTTPCPNAERRLCGFEERKSAEERLVNGETLLVRSIEMQGRPVEVRITLTYASASPFYDRNLGVLKAKQERYTRTSEENFFGGLRTADFVFYIGHSRNGGGPDFNPPRLIPGVGKPDYMGYYRKAFPGRTRMLQELAKTSNKNVTVGLFSCDSNLHFRSRLLGQNSKQRAILTIGTTGSINYFDVMKASLSYLEGVLRGSCGAQLEQFARPTEKDKISYQQYNLK